MGNQAGKLDAVGIRGLFSIDIDLTVNDLQFVARGADTAFYVVFAFINGTSNHLILTPDHFPTLSGRIGSGVFHAHLLDVLRRIAAEEVVPLCHTGVGVEHRLKLAHDGVIALSLTFHHHRVAVGVVENHHVVAFHGVEGLGTHVRQLDDFGVGLGSLRAGQFIVNERNGHRRLRSAYPVSYLTDRQKISDHQRTLHGGGRDGIEFEPASSDDVGGGHREDQRIAPRAGGRLLRAFQIFGCNVLFLR